MIISGIVLGLIIVGSVIWSVFWGGKLPAPFGLRSCQGKHWHKTFPEASKPEIRKFLTTFTQSFAFREREKLKLNPNDQLLDIYKALYPHQWQADALEFETLAEALETEYQLNISNIWRSDLTLGQLFAIVNRSRQVEV